MDSYVHEERTEDTEWRRRLRGETPAGEILNGGDDLEEKHPLGKYWMEETT